MNNISVSTSGLLTGSGNRKCPADTWILSAEPGQRIELIVRDYTSRGVATLPGDYDGAEAAADAAARDDDDDGVEDDAVNDGKSRSEMCTNIVLIVLAYQCAWRLADSVMMHR